MAARKAPFRPKTKNEIVRSVRQILSDIGHGDLIQQANEASGMLCVMPVDATYEAQNRGEVIVFIVRRHVFTVLPKLLQIILMIFVPVILLSIVSSYDAASIQANSSMVIGLVLFWYLFTLTVSLRIFLDWYYDVFIITNERIVDIDASLGRSRTSGTAISAVEDVSVSQSALWQNLFDFGNVDLQTAGAMREFEMVDVPKPRIIQDAILDLRIGR